MAVYAAGYNRTRSAAAKLETQSNERRPALPAPPQGSLPAPRAIAELQPQPEAPAANVAPEPAATAKPPVKSSAASPAPTPESSTPSTPEPAAPVPAETTPAPAAAPAPAPVAPVPPPPPPAPAAPVYKDGTYTGWGTSRHGDIQASVVIEGGKIASATIAQCLTRYSCSVIEMLPPQVAKRQSPEVDYVSGATQSTNAFYYAVVEALNKAK
jgi:outer membrane biosynthesis protein TonB